MWTMAVPWWEFLVRGAIVYLFLIVLLRLSGKRQVGQLAPFDLVLLLVLSNAVQNSMNGGDNSVIGGLISASTLVALNWVIGYATFRNKRFEQFVEGKPQIIIHDGHVYRDVMNRERLTQHELEAALRAAGCAAITDVILRFSKTTAKSASVVRQSLASGVDAPGAAIAASAIYSSDAMYTWMQQLPHPVHRPRRQPRPYDGRLFGRCFR